MRSEIQGRAKFDYIRYAQCWEDADLLVAALDPQGRKCISIGSAGDNSFSLLAAGAEQVVAVEMNATQLACISLRHAAYRSLEHEEFLELIGSRPSECRWSLYEKCRKLLDANAREFWDARKDCVMAGIGSAGKFENYFKIFRERILPFAHNRRIINELLKSKSGEQRRLFYEQKWNNWRWKLLFRLFFSRFTMGRMGRDPEFFQYVKGNVAERILARTRHALVELDSAANPYLHWILTGTHGEALPHALRKESFEVIRQRLADDPNCFQMKHQSLEEFLHASDESFDAYNLSDIFEYMSESSMCGVIKAILAHSRKGTRLAYWNMLVPRSHPKELSHLLRSHDERAAVLFSQDKAWFYSRFIIEEVNA